MKRPSNLIIAFIFAIAGIFGAYALGRIFVRAIFPPQFEIEEDLESRVDVPHILTYKPNVKIK